MSDGAQPSPPPAVAEPSPPLLRAEPSPSPPRRSTPATIEGPGTANTGDWVCPKCQATCFAKKATCFKCHEPKPASTGSAAAAKPASAKAGDWLMWACPKCHAKCYASRTTCFKCNEPKPPRTLSPREGKAVKHGVSRVKMTKIDLSGTSDSSL